MTPFPSCAPTDQISLVSPSDERQLADFLAERAQSRRPLRIVGGGTRMPAGAVSADDTLSSRNLTGVVAYEPGELTLIARAGTPLAEIEAVAAVQGQALAFEPMDPRAALGSNGVPTIGGVVGANVSGPRRIQSGACRDHVLGVRFVDGRGRVIKNGGRVMKNVTGLDLGKLLCGSHGTLGVLTEVAIKTLPAPERQATIAFSSVTAQQAVEVFSMALATPFEVSGAAFHAGTAWLRIEGLSRQVAYRCERLTALFGQYDLDVLDDANSRPLWRRLRDVEHFAGSSAPLWRILAKPSAAPDIAAALESLGGATSIDWGGGLIWHLGESEDCRIRAATPQGHATLIGRGAPHVSGVFPIQAPAVEAIASALRRTFDPAGILNPGLMGD